MEEGAEREWVRNAHTERHTRALSLSTCEKVRESVYWNSKLVSKNIFQKNQFSKTNNNFIGQGRRQATRMWSPVDYVSEKTTCFDWRGDCGLTRGVQAFSFLNYLVNSIFFNMILFCSVSVIIVSEVYDCPFRHLWGWNPTGYRGRRTSGSSSVRGVKCPILHSLLFLFSFYFFLLVN